MIRHHFNEFLVRIHLFNRNAGPINVHWRWDFVLGKTQINTLLSISPFSCTTLCSIFLAFGWRRMWITHGFCIQGSLSICIVMDLFDVILTLVHLYIWSEQHWFNSSERSLKHITHRVNHLGNYWVNCTLWLLKIQK